MGLLNIHDYGNLDSLHLRNYQQVYYGFDCWWNECVTLWIVQRLTQILTLDAPDDDIKEQIRKFRMDIHLSIDDDINQQDIIRFKSLNVVKWLYTDFMQKFKIVFGFQMAFDMTNLLEAAVSSSIDSISFLPEVAENMQHYNRFVERLIHSVVIWLKMLHGFTHKIKRRYIAAVVIQRQWRNSIADPNYFLCRKRLMDEFSRM